jgi:NADH dehydrogenase [ubiquinone] 1 alpha subcomplex assembly factor 7
MTPLGRALAERIRSDGPLSVEAYMEACNSYYYATRDPLGSSGDFTTAPEIHQMFGELIGAALADVWTRAGKPTDIAYVELGPGRGTLAADARRVMERAGLRPEIHFVETSEALRQAQGHLHGDAEWHESLLTIPPDLPILVVANEFFDALPVRQWVGEEERKVAFNGDRFTFTLEGPIREDSPQRDAYAWEIGAQLDVRGGVAIIIDYGHSSGEHGETLQAVKGHAYAYPLSSPGEQDLTAHVDFSALAAASRVGEVKASRVISQGTWLETLGIGARAMALAAKNPADTERISVARRRLCDEGEMGRLFKVIALTGKGWPDVAGLES